MKKLLVSLMLIISSVAVAQQTAGTLDPAQVYTTGNIVQMTTTSTGSTWVNGVYQDQLTCWAWGNPGYCGPNAIVRPGNNINFSYGLTDLYQVQSIASVLPTTGLRVNGYNFGFTAKNGNGWDDGRQDYLTAYVSFYGTDGKVKDYTSYDLNSIFNWTTFNYTKDFVTPYSASDLSTVRYGFVGRDNNYWAGPYGPEIYNVSFSLKYSVDPCSVNILSSPTCPGYLDALAKLSPATTTVTTDPITTTSISPTTTTTIVTDPVTSTVNVTNTTTIGQPSVVSPVVSAPSSTSSTTTSTTQSSKETTSSGGNVSLALSVISKNQDRDATNASIAQTAVTQAQQAAQQAQQESLSVASSAVANSMSANIVGNANQTSNGTGIKVSNSNTTSTTLSINSPVSSNMLTPGTVILSSPSTQQIFETPSLVINTQQNTSISTTFTPIASLSQTNETYSIIPPNVLTDKSNPLNDAFEQKQLLPQSNISMSVGPVVNKNAQDNDVAGGVSINKMAVAPIGYGDYLNFAMKDVAFYAPKEVYKNQRNVDNARALRQMTNDAKHKEMVEMQYVK